MMQQDFFSEDTARLVDSEIRHFIQVSHDKATQIISSHKDLLHVLSKELLEKETLSVDEIFDIVLANVNDQDKEIIEKKYNKALEMKIDPSPKENKAEKDNENTELETEYDEENKISELDELEDADEVFDKDDENDAN